MEKITIKIDEQDFSVPKGTTVLEAALAHNIHIPHLCHHPDLKPVGSCRICLVELDNGRLITSCRTTVIEGMVVKTKSPAIDRVRRPIVEMLIANHHMDCKNCSKKGNCVLQKIRAKTKIDKKSLERLRPPIEELPIDDSNPFFERNPNKCVLCGICIRTCKDIQKVNAINFVGRGYSTRVSPFKDTPIAQSRCESCGECVVRCPVGALVAKNFKRPKDEVRSVCPYCGVGCGIYLGTRENSLVNVRGDSESHVNAGQLCVRGRFGLGFVSSTERLTAPLIKQNGKFTKASWDEALDMVSGKLKHYKGDEFALLASTKCTNEDSYIAQKFTRVVMGSNNVDSSARLCHASSINALYETTGRKAIASAMSETENSKCILVAGTNITKTHPVAGLRIKRAVENGAKLIVISPNEIDLCRYAPIWLRPYPGTDAALIMGMCGVIADEGMLDENFIKEQCDNFEDFKTSLDSFTPGRVERITGVDRDVIVEAAKLYADDKPATILWSTGITQHPHGIDTVLSFVNLA
ncbi:MAG: molybdopterin-dependent oxidoreductase, partial [Thermodesulfovibrionia bacterium]|nr:molybdopterin-dependent oxidoreductase [Thermodesulfovibrionia bacterium]